MSESAYGYLADQAAERAGIPTNLFRSLVGVESSWRPFVVSSAGAVGLSQLMPINYEAQGVNPYSPRENLAGGAKVLADFHERFGDWRAALSAYNTGRPDSPVGLEYADKVLTGAGEIVEGNGASGSWDEPSTNWTGGVENPLYGLGVGPEYLLRWGEQSEDDGSLIPDVTVTEGPSNPFTLNLIGIAVAVLLVGGGIIYILKSGDTK